ncbi:hypothetical protein AVEN_92946-1, partial [Araneus ventricosus]
YFATQLKHVSHFETNFSTPVSKKSAARERSQRVTAVCLHVVVTGEMLLRQKHFQVLAHDCRWEIATKPRSLSCGTARTLKWLRWEVFDHPAYSPDLAPSDYHLLQHL